MAAGYVRKNLPSWHGEEWQAEQTVPPAIASAMLKWAGEVEYIDSETPDEQFFADDTSANGATTVPGSLGYVPRACSINKLRVNVTANAIATNTVQFYLYKNGVATGLNVSYVPAETGIKSSVAVTVTFNGTTDTLDFVAKRSTGATGVADVSATVDYT